jgi:type III restriction enzyme
MKFTLKDYQEEAVSEVLLRLRRGRRRWHEDREVQAFSLTAPTGAGKTIMAAAVFEAHFHGDDEAEADPGAVVIWFSDDPSLNEQTRFRLGEASDRLNWTNLHVVENSFNREKFSPGKVYFLNTHKLSRNSLLVRGHERGVETEPSLPDMGPDARSYTIWDTIRNTIDDPVLTLYLVLDEAHRGLGEGRTLHDRSTIVRRLINGADTVPPMPIVWGISATVERFNVAMREAQGRSILSGGSGRPGQGARVGSAQRHDRSRYSRRGRAFSDGSRPSSG